MCSARCVIFDAVRVIFCIIYDSVQLYFEMKAILRGLKVVRTGRSKLASTVSLTGAVPIDTVSK